MSTLLVRLAGPMQSWGTQSRFTTRDTGLEPSKSGVIGLLCAALGMGRDSSLDELGSLRMGVRVDQPGSVKLDYQTSGGGTFSKKVSYGVRTSSDKPGRTAVSNRYYLSDADFLVGLETADDGLLGMLHNALENPVWQLCLGRKAFVPGVPVYVTDGLWPHKDLEEALTDYPWPRPDLEIPQDKPERLRFTFETVAEEGDEVRMDQPYGVSFTTRQFRPRQIKNSFRELGDGYGKIPVREPAQEDEVVPVKTDH